MNKAWVVVSVLEDELTGDVIYFDNFMEAMDYAQKRAATFVSMNVLVCEIKRNVKVPSLMYKKITDGLEPHESCQQEF